MFTVADDEVDELSRPVQESVNVVRCVSAPVTLPLEPEAHALLAQPAAAPVHEIPPPQRKCRKQRSNYSQKFTAAWYSDFSTIYGLENTCNVLVQSFSN